MTDQEMIDWVLEFTETPEFELDTPNIPNIIADVRAGVAPVDNNDGFITDPIEAMLMGCITSGDPRYWIPNLQPEWSDEHDAVEDALISAYNDEGVTGVIKWVQENRPDWAWKHCPDCEQYIPVWETETGGMLCAACWTELSASEEESGEEW